MKRYAGLTLGLVILAASLAYAFRWQYSTVPVPGERFGSYEISQAARNIRTNRWTGEAEVLTSSGWRPMNEFGGAFAGLDR